ncbi:hypothetical protein CUZ56_00578 [Saezia sanguinis]|uniref:Uncharacterized protein n=1 Tax=Saezia sanguinis TaxID=1965230 RepID=A0A433SH79_9BURK|nr:hypothetical protein [Saezia sanguinis]RUS68093.1 hypothetical protein CUZ56_00578 [Saezia sanguinis]
MKRNAPQRSQMAEQLQQLSQSPQAAGLIKQTSHSASPQKPYSARPSNNSDPRSPAKSSSQPWKEELPQTAALAIAANIAESRIKGIFQAHSNYDSKVINPLKQALQSPSPTNALLPYANELQTLWESIVLTLPNDRQIYKTDAVKQLLMAELLVQLNTLRNYYSHMSRMGDPFDLTAKPQFCHFLQKLYDEARTSLNAVPPAPLIEVKQAPNVSGSASSASTPPAATYRLQQPWGVVFLLSLLLPRSQTERLLQHIAQPPHALKRRTRRLFTYFSRRDGYSETQLDATGMLCRELIGYLTLPPVESAAGQEALADWRQQLAKLPAGEYPTTTPQFRSQDKIRAYLHTVLDALHLLTGLHFWGHYQRQQTDADGSTSLWVNEPGRSIAQANPDPEQQQQGIRSKNTRNDQYGRNTGLEPGRRFVYDMLDGNLRISLANPADAAAPRVEGVLRLRDFINLAYTVLTQSSSTATTQPSVQSTILQAMYDWLTRYQASLKPLQQGQTPSADHTELQKHYPAQIQHHITGTAPTLLQRLQARVQARLDRVRLLIARDREQPATATRGSATEYKHNLPRHEQVHEILHDFIACLNKEGRALVTRHEFVHLQKLLLQYKGITPTDFRYLKQLAQPSVGNSPQRPAQALSNKGEFWHYIHDKYPADLVTGNKTHPIWESCISTSTIDRRESVVSLGKLCADVLHRQQRQLIALQRELQRQTQPNEENETRLKQIAAELQLSLQESAQTASGKPAAGLQAALHNAQHYSVIPASFIQQALGQRTTQPQRIGNSTQETTYTNLAQTIREYPTSLTLLPDFYNPEKRHPKLAGKMAATQKLSALAPDEKKQWKHTVKTLNDWHTHDKLCLIMAERLAQQADITLPQGTAVNALSLATPEVELQGTDPCGQDKTLYLQLSDSHQSTRRWFTWSQQKLGRALALHHTNNDHIPSSRIPELIARYQGHYHHIVQAILTFEQQFYQQRPRQKKELEQQQLSKNENYVPFHLIANQAGLSQEHIKAINYLRNIALHDAMPGSLKGQQWEIALSQILPQHAEIKVDDIGKDQLNYLESFTVTPKP